MITANPVFLGLVSPDGLLDRAEPIAVTLSYARADPLAVRMDMRDSDGPVTWLFSRELLSCGLSVPTGDADVRVFPGSAVTGKDVAFLRLRSQDGQGLFAMPRQEVSDFLDRTYALVARGDESPYLDVDGWIGKITETQ